MPARLLKAAARSVFFLIVRRRISCFAGPPDFMMRAESRVCTGRGLCSQSRLHAAKSVFPVVDLRRCQERGRAASEKKPRVPEVLSYMLHTLFCIMAPSDRSSYWLVSRRCRSLELPSCRRQTCWLLCAALRPRKTTRATHPNQ